MADENPVKRKEREPITYVFSVILLAACILAIGIFVNDHILNDDSVYSTNESTVTVNYTGALYNYYDNGGYMFQTTVASIDENEDYARISDYSYSSSKLTINLHDGSISGQSGSAVLKGFYTACIGHKVGETIKVCIPAAEGYKAPETNSIIDTLSVTARNNYYSATSTVKAADDMGWTYTASFDASKNAYLISYTMDEAADITASGISTATVKTTGFSYGSNTMTYKVAISDVTATPDIVVDGTTYKGFEGVTIPCGDGTANIVGASVVTDGVASGNLVTKATREIDNQDLYFTIEITEFK